MTPPIDLVAVALEKLAEANRAYDTTPPHDAALRAKLLRHRDKARRDLLAVCLLVAELKGNAGNPHTAKCQMHFTAS